MAVDYGTDISDFPDLDPMMPDYTGRGVLLEAIYRRLSTPRGALFYDADYGYDLTELIGNAFDVSSVGVIQTLVEREVRKDERVTSVRAQVSYNSLTQTLNVAVQLQDGTGPFALVLAVTQVSVTVLNAQT